MQTLYKRSKTGAILQWSIFTKGNQYWTEHGQVGGKIITGKPTICEGTNIGRSNERTPEEQAVFVAERMWKDRQRVEGYSIDINRVDDGKEHFECTLAHKWTEKTAAKLPNKVLVSPKLDGLRCIIDKDGAYTRNGKRYVTSKFIEESLEEFFGMFPHMILDGELYCHELHDDFNRITSLARKTKENSITDEEWDEIEGKLKLHVFDVCNPSFPGMTFSERYEFICKYLKINPFVEIVPNTLVTQDEIHECHAKYIEEGYEGIMIRNPLMQYEHTRSKNLLKYKEFIDDEFEVVDITAGKGLRSTMAGRIHCVTKDGVEFEASMRGTHEYFTELLENKSEYIGLLATVRYQNLTPDGKPRFGVMVDIGRKDL